MDLDTYFQPQNFQSDEKYDSLQAPQKLSVHDPEVSVANVVEKKYCLTKGCVQAAADLLDKLDQTVNPCEDFYQFDCGGYVEKTIIPDDRTRTSMFSHVGDKLN